MHIIYIPYHLELSFLLLQFYLYIEHQENYDFIMDEIKAHPVRISAFAAKTPERPAGLTNTTPETSRFLDALEKKYREDHRIAANALSFGDYGKAGV